MSVSPVAAYRSSTKAFTLIELLVVISIIALLIGILLPALGAARNTARSAVSLSNQRGNGQAVQMYITNNKGYFPTAYQYRAQNNWNDKGLSDDNTTGYLQWSGAIAQEGYFDLNSKAFIDPRHAVEGWAPTNFAISAAEAATPITTGMPASHYLESNPGGQGRQTAVADTQALRLSYVPNELVMPRLKTLALKNGRRMRLARIDEMQKQSGTILLAEYSDHILAMQGGSGSGGQAVKTHRPTNGVKAGASAVFNGESAGSGVAGDSNAWNGTTMDIRALSFDEVAGTGSATAGFDSVNPNKGGTSNNDEHAHHIVYTANDRHNGGGNYAFVDGHGANHRLEDTLNPDDYLWGTQFWTHVSKAPVLSADGSRAVR